MNRPSDHRLQGRVVVLTGAAGGIGRALSAAFVAQGAHLVAVDRVLPDDLLPGLMRQRPEAVHGDAPAAAPLAMRADLSSDADVAALVAEIGARCGRVDVLVNNAGVEYPTPLADAAPDAMARWAALLDNNVVGMVRLTRSLLPWLGAGASVINQSSIWGHTAVADFSAYSASKHAVIGLTRSLAFELAPRGIRVNAVCPGWIRTEAAMRSLASMAQQRGVSEALLEGEIVARQALPTMLEPADLAGVFLFLASDDARALTGQSIAVSHGEVML
ncbi:MAG: SDR family NAD(P)-dependent oxidoreductase [Leptothrix sp. (in: b-proteobacteria)]